MNKRDDFVQKIYRYQKATEFLRDYHIFQKENSKTWSYEFWARKLGQTKSTLVRTLNGSLAMSEALEKAFTQYFKFDTDQKSYFKLLVIYEKMKALYPDIHIQLPTMDAVKSEKHKLTDRGGLAAENTLFLSQPEVGWLLTRLSGSGVPRKDLLKIQKDFHEGLGHVDFSELVEECFRRGLLVEEKERVIFRSLEGIHLDGSMTGLEFTVGRYSKILDAFKKMLLKDFAQGQVPLMNNRAFTIRIRSERFNELVWFVDEFLTKKAMALFEDEKGDLVVDLQAFMAPIASLQGPFDRKVLAPTKPPTATKPGFSK